MVHARTGPTHPLTSLHTLIIPNISLPPPLSLKVYEILKLPDFSLFYYRKAASLQPYDARMWEALGNAYENVRPPRVEDALKVKGRFF